jgi:formylglycine-generating enzyme required for sulfatase activity
MARGLVSRGDLLRALCAGGRELAPAALRALGYEPEPAKREAAPVASTSLAGPLPATETGTGPPVIAPAPLAPAAFWMPLRLESDEILLPGDGPRRSAPALPSRPPGHPSPYRYLATFAQLVPRLRRALSAERPSRAYDLGRIVQRMGRGELLRWLPRRRRAGWGPSLYVIEDRCDHLAPYVRDQAMVQTHLQQLFPAAGFRAAIYSENRERPEVYWPDGEFRPIDPQPSDQVLVLGDLGCLARDGGRAARFWRDFGDELELLGVSALALLPCAPAECAPKASPHFQLLCWEHPAPPVLAGDALQERGGRLLARMAIASRIEPVLLRELRLGLGGVDRFPARLEAWAWQQAGGEGAAMVAAALPDKDAETQRAKLREAEEPTPMGTLLATARDAMRHLPYEVWLETVLNFADWAPDAISDAERRDALALLEHLADRVSAPGPKPLGPRALDWLTGFFERLDESVKQSTETKHACWALACALADQGRPPEAPPSEQAVPLDLYQLGDRLHLQSVPGASPLARVHTRDGHIQLGAGPAQGAAAFWDNGRPPTWAKRWGRDQYGAWVELELAGRNGEPVVQRMRWIEPGEFMMGSPEDEPGRWDAEGPRHRVVIGEGYWLFDTPCTQALWEAVMGKNPSRFVDRRRPVEQVNWHDAQAFLQRLNGLKAGLGLALPSEAQWEYACRAGTDTALYNGPIAILGERNASALDPIAWYGGNSGVEYDLRKAEKTTGDLWEEMQYPTKRAGTRKVRQKHPNAWGLYDMLGNVWEWTEDHWHDSYKGAPADATPWVDTGADADASRVIRGGSWSGIASYCRSAYRGLCHPGYRVGFLGFRPARASGGEHEQGKSAAGGPAAARPAERIRTGGGGAGSRSEGQGWPVPASVQIGDAKGVVLRLDSAAEAGAPLPRAPTLRIRTDREVLTLGLGSKPGWARAMGRDRYGLWADLRIEAPNGAPVIQRLRWIPPGRFLMGAPEDEPGRYSDERPRHPVLIEHGYWLFDTPCTQALWEALMGNNPSDFQTRDRPVEQVSWREAQAFLTRLNERLADHRQGDSGEETFSLPSEAQWEYACRAGTDTALYTGSMEILGAANAPALDPIAWYGGNSNRDFELENGRERTWLSDMQYPEGKAGTHPVGKKLPNAWGLYDMLGNIWEWTQDHWHGSYDGAPSNGSPWLDASADADADRVIRGGSWGGGAGGCRSACRGG